ncbi:MAG: AAA family ATPase [Acidobacteriota bacterium]
MRLRSFSIRNYKSIIDSGKCSFDADMLVLAGRNEAGKTATLEALRDFDPDIKVFEESALPVGRPNAVPSLRLVFEIDQSALRDLSTAAKISWDQSAENDICEKGLSLLKTQSGEECDYAIGEDLKAVISKQGCALNVGEEARLVKEILKVIPRFELFADFSSKLPARISLDSARNDSTVVAIAQEAGLDLDQLEATRLNPRHRRRTLNKAAERINNVLEDYLEGVKLVPNADGDELFFWIQDELTNELFEPHERSKGFQWLLACYLELCTRKNQVILIDEPALYLHPRAQGTVLKLLGNAVARNIQIIYSTHSPFLIDADKLGRVKLVVKDKDGTKINDKFHYTTDTDALTPIIKAIGLDIGAGLSATKKYNVVVEGITDYYYLQALRQVVAHEFDDFSIIPSTGADNIPQISSILYGWGLRFVVVFDNDREGAKVTKRLRNSLGLEDGQIILIPGAEGESSIEDLFTPDDFNNYVLSALGRRNDDRAKKNSEFLKPQRALKVPLAKNLYQAISTKSGNITFSVETIHAFSTLFSQISSYFKRH